MFWLDELAQMLPVFANFWRYFAIFRRNLAKNRQNLPKNSGLMSYPYPLYHLVFFRKNGAPEHFDGGITEKCWARYLYQPPSLAY